MRRSDTLFGLLVSACLLVACGGGGSSPTGEPATPSPAGTAVVGSAGARITGVDGARVDVPPGALPEGDARLSISIAKDSTDAPPVPPGFRTISDTFAVTPHGIRFLQPVTVTLPFDAAALPADRKPALLKVTPGRPWQLIENVTVSGNTVSAAVDSLSYFQVINLPAGGLYVVNPPAPPPPTQASFSLTLENPGWSSLSATGSNTRIVQQLASDDPARVRWQAVVPDASDLAQTCWTGDIRISFVRQSAAVYHRPGDPPAGTNRVAVDPNTAYAWPQFRSWQGARNEVVLINSASDRWNPRPPAQGLLALLGPAADIPADAVIDSIGAEVHLEVECLGAGTGGLFGTEPEVIWSLDNVVAPLMVQRAFDPPRITVNEQPEPMRVVLDGQSIEVAGDAQSTYRPLAATLLLGFPRPQGLQGTARWERAAPGTDTWVEVPTAPYGTTPPGGGIFSDAISDGVLPNDTQLRGTVSATRDNGARFRARFCLAATATTPQECVTSRPTTLTVSTQFPAPRFTTQPRSQTFPVGQTMSLTAAFEGFPLPLVLNWQTRTADNQPWEAVDTATWQNAARAGRPVDLSQLPFYSTGSDTLVSTRPLTIADRGRQFRATYTTIAGTATSQAATINVTTGQTPPSISVQPADLTAGNGQTAVFTALAEGAAPLSYQWTFNGQRIPGANAPTLVLGTINSANAGLYALQVSNVEDTVTSRSARLSVTGAAPPPMLGITTNPASQTVPAGANAAFAVVATGAAPLVYQWERDGQAIPGANEPVLMLTGVTSAQAGQYTVLVGNGAGSVRSMPARLTVGAPAAPPQPLGIVTDPAAQRVPTGGTAAFAVVATGAAPLAYQWERDGVAIAGANAPVLVLSGVTEGDAGNYTVVVGSGEATVRSLAARLTVTAPTPAPVPLGITTDPVAQTVTAGGTAAFAVAATGTAPLAYQWFFNGVAMLNANSPVLTVVNVSDAQAGDYTVQVSSGGASVRSLPARLTVRPPAVALPTIDTQPVGLTVTLGQRAVMAVGASGGGALAFQWSRGGSVLPGATAAVLVIDAASGSDAGNYTVTVSNAAGSVTSAPAGLVVAAPPGAPLIVEQPSNLGVSEGAIASFMARVTGDPAPACQWTRNGIAIAGATSCGGYATPAVTLADNGSIYNLIAYSTGGVAIGRGAVLTVGAAPTAPVITQDLADASAPDGGTASFSIAATANGLINYYWVLGGAPTVEQGGSSFSVGPLQPSDTGRFVRVIVCNGTLAGGLCTASRDALITVTPAVPVGALTATQVLAGFEWSVVLRPDRTVWGWGGLHKVDGTVVVSNLAPTDQARRPVRLYPGLLTDVRQIAGWYDGFWAITGEPGSAASRVLHWGNARSGNDGRGADGQGNLGVLPQFRANAVPVPMLERRTVNGSLQAAPVDRVCSIAATSDRVLLIRALDAAGNATSCAAGAVKTVWMAGTLTQYSADAVGVVLPVAGLPAAGAPSYSPPASVHAAQPSSYSSAAPVVVVLEDGRAFAWGDNYGNRLGMALPAPAGYQGGVSAPVALRSAWGSPVDVVFSYNGMFMLRGDGSILASGRNENRELGQGDQLPGTQNDGPVAVLQLGGAPLSGVSQLASTYVQVSLALRNGEILAWGAPNQPLKGGGAASGWPTVLPASGNGWRALSASNAHALAIAANGAVYSWGNGLRGALGNGQDSGSIFAPNLVTLP